MKTHTTIPSADVDPFGCAEMACRLILSAIMVGCAVSVSSCRSPLIEINRTGSLISSEIQVNDSLHNNNIPLIK